jgi:hypothetical protein
MGIFKDINAVQRQAKELGKDSPGVGARFADMNQKMGALTASLETSTVAMASSSPNDVSAEAQVLSVEPATGYLNGDPIVTVSVLIHRHGTPPVPATQSIVVPALQAHRLQQGARIRAHVDPTDPEAIVLDWST